MTDENIQDPRDNMEHNEVSLGNLYAEVLDDIDAIVASITDTEVDVRLDQLLAGLPVADLAQELAETAEPFLDLAQAAGIPQLTEDPCPSPEAELERVRWELTLARMQLERDRAAADERLAEAEAYLDAAVGRAAQIINEARNQAEELISAAETSAQTTRARAAQMVTAAETLCQVMIAETSRESSAAITEKTALQPTARTAEADPWVRRMAGGMAKLLRVPLDERETISLGIRNWLTCQAELFETRSVDCVVDIKHAPKSTLLSGCTHETPESLFLLLVTVLDVNCEMPMPRKHSLEKSSPGGSGGTTRRSLRNAELQRLKEIKEITPKAFAN